MIKTLNDVAHELRNGLVRTGDPLCGLAWDVKYESKVSNSHSCPKTGVTNWGSDDDKPKGYRGFRGRIWVRYFKEPQFMSASDNIKKFGCHPGTGGGGCYDGPWTLVSHAAYKLGLRGSVHCYSWDVKIFLDDFPEIAHEVEKVRMWNILNNKPFSYRHQYEWFDEEIQSKDERLIERLQKEKDFA